jgi:hypothetical protein
MVILAGKSSSLLRPRSLPGIAVNKHLHERAGQPYADFEMRSASEYEFNTASGKAETMSCEAYPLSEQGPSRRKVPDQWCLRVKYWPGEQDLQHLRVIYRRHALKHQ